MRSHQTVRGASARQRARRRGAVVIEALIISSCLTILLGACVYTHRVYRAKLRVTQEARAQAWVAGMNCNSALSGQAFAPMATSLMSGVDQDGKDPEMADDALSGAGNVADQSVSRSENISPAFGLPALNVSARNTILCNETPGEASGLDSLLGTFVQSPF